MKTFAPSSIAIKSCCCEFSHDSRIWYLCTKVIHRESNWVGVALGNVSKFYCR